MSFDLDKWSIETTKFLATIHHANDICEQRGQCVCGREITLLKLQYQIAILMTEYSELKEQVSGNHAGHTG